MNIFKRIIVCAIALMMFAACSNPTTPAGYVGYVQQGSVFGKTRFYEIQTGPTSTGLGWLLNVTNINITPTNIDETFTGDNTVLAADKLKISFSAHLVYRIKVDKAQEAWEKYSEGLTKDGSEADIYAMYNAFIKQKFCNIVRDEVTKFNGLDVQSNIEPISKAITTRMHDFLDNTPFDVITAMVGNIQYPPQVADAVAGKLAVTQDLQKEQTNIQIVQVKAQQRVAEARGIADSMAIINNQLSPLYLQHEAIQAQEKMINSPNHTEIYIPVGTNGVPLVGQLNVGNK